MARQPETRAPAAAGAGAGSRAGLGTRGRNCARQLPGGGLRGTSRRDRRGGESPRRGTAHHRGARDGAGRPGAGGQLVVVREGPRSGRGTAGGHRRGRVAGAGAGATPHAAAGTVRDHEGRGLDRARLAARGAQRGRACGRDRARTGTSTAAGGGRRAGGDGPQAR